MSKLAESEQVRTPVGWVVEWEPGEFVMDGDVICLYSKKRAAEKQARAQRAFPNPWPGIQVVPLYRAAAPEGEPE